MSEAELKKQLDIIEQKLNALLVIQNVRMDDILGKHYRGYNALSAFEEYWANDPDYLAPTGELVSPWVRKVAENG